MLLVWDVIESALTWDCANASQSITANCTIVSYRSTSILFIWLTPNARILMQKKRIKILSALNILHFFHSIHSSIENEWQNSMIFYCYSCKIHLTKTMAFKMKQHGISLEKQFYVLNNGFDECIPHSMNTHKETRKREISICIWCRHIYAFVEKISTRNSTSIKCRVFDTMIHTVARKINWTE